jgi:hypothetical protein
MIPISDKKIRRAQILLFVVLTLFALGCFLMGVGAFQIYLTIR